MTDDANNYEKYESRGADDDSSAVKKATSKSFIDLQHLSSQVYLCDAIIFHVSSTICHFKLLLGRVLDGGLS